MTRLVAVLLAALAIAVPLSLLAGRVWIDPFDPLQANAAVILMELRLPRAALALVVGAGLGGAGAVMGRHTVFNPADTARPPGRTPA